MSHRRYDLGSSEAKDSGIDRKAPSNFEMINGCWKCWRFRGKSVHPNRRILDKLTNPEKTQFLWKPACYGNIFPPKSGPPAKSVSREILLVFVNFVSYVTPAHDKSSALRGEQHKFSNSKHRNVSKCRLLRDNTLPCWIISKHNFFEHKKFTKNPLSTFSTTRNLLSSDVLDSSEGLVSKKFSRCPKGKISLLSILSPQLNHWRVCLKIRNSAARDLLREKVLMRSDGTLDNLCNFCCKRTGPNLDCVQNRLSLWHG